jgi:hypothetical protein
MAIANTAPHNNSFFIVLVFWFKEIFLQQIEAKVHSHIDHSGTKIILILYKTSRVIKYLLKKSPPAILNNPGAP